MTVDIILVIDFDFLLLKKNTAIKVFEGKRYFFEMHKRYREKHDHSSETKIYRLSIAVMSSEWRMGTSL